MCVPSGTQMDPVIFSTHALDFDVNTLSHVSPMSQTHQHGKADQQGSLC